MRLFNSLANKKIKIDRDLLSYNFIWQLFTKSEIHLASSFAFCVKKKSVIIYYTYMQDICNNQSYRQNDVDKRNCWQSRL